MPIVTVAYRYSYSCTKCDLDFTITVAEMNWAGDSTVSCPHCRNRRSVKRTDS